MSVAPAARFSDKIAFVILLASVVTGCGSAKEEAAPPLDSGPRIAIDSIIAQVPSIGLDGKPNFGSPGPPTRLGDGRILVSDRSTASLLIFDPSGFQVAAVGRRGRGPGEFVAPIPLGRCGGDSVYVWDPSLRRISVIGPDGKLAREFPMEGATLRPVCAPDGRLVVMRAPKGPLEPAPGKAASPPAPAPLVLMTANGDSISLLTTVPIGDFRPLGGHTLVAAGPDRFYVATGDSGYADMYDYTGKKLGALDIADPPRAMTDSAFNGAVDLMLASMASPAQREAARARIEAMGRPDHIAPYRLIWVAPAGDVWAVLSPYGDSLTRIRVTAPDGTRLGDFSLPDGFTPFDVGRDYVLGLAETPSGEQVVREYRVTRR